MAIKLGQTVEDKITGFKGVVTGRVEYLTGCNQVLLVPRVGTDGAFIEAQWFDEQRCETLDAPIFALAARQEPPGWDAPAPKQ